MTKKSRFVHRIRAMILIGGLATGTAASLTLAAGPASASTGAVAVTWANAHDGEIYGTAAEQPASAHQWSGYCWTFVFDAFGGTVPREPTAQDGWNYYAAQGMTHTGAPPSGSIAFWSYGTDGHAAVAVGGGMTVGTHGTASNRYAVEKVAYNNRGLTYLGWVDPNAGSSRARADLVVHNPSNNTWAVAFSTGHSFSGMGTGLSGWGVGDWAGLADFTGDGKADVIVHNPSNNTWAVAVNDGTGHFNAPGTGTWITGWSAGDWAGFADLNGDGKADLVVHNPSNNTWAVALSTGHSFSGLGTGLSGWGKGDWAGLADVTGDGKADLLVHNPSNNTFAVAVNDGTGHFNAPGTGTWLTGWSAGDWVGLADVNGDGKADLVVHNPSNNTWAVALSTGHSFSGLGTGLSGWGKGDRALLADATGDGKADIIVHNPSNNTWAVAVNDGTGHFNAPGTGTWITGWSAGDLARSADVGGL